MGGRLLWQFGAGRMVPPDTRNNVIEPSCLRDEFPTRGTPANNSPAVAWRHPRIWKSHYKSNAYQFRGNPIHLRLAKIAPGRMNLTKG